MKPFFAFFIVFSLLLGANLSYGRKELVGEYWKKMIKGQSMPEAIKEILVVEDPQISSSDSSRTKDNFIRDFDIKPNVILYHSHKQKQKHNHKNPFLNNNLEEPEFQETENK
ncbi:uncharacterized protein LOC107634084 [Arachis ipaensis]|uniref:uncharacterized protein LOC107634084 n=1 Tax=Arachis ipaensis TaxID=130454 RepID=UPI0007AF99C0|nr:uncharacterized protein LOC107634084 [Arachis ipaensis]